MALETALRVLIWAFKLIVETIYIPISITRLFKSSRRCPPIKNKTLLISASEIAQRIRKKQITSVEVVQAYISRINEVNPIINAVVENRFQEALQEAETVDKFIETTQLNEEEIRREYPLLGVPITVKGSIALTGLLHSAGRVDHQVEAKTDAVVVKHAKKAGAIPLLVSNVPELCLNWETFNKLTGKTSNPYDTTRTPGGSSGGEASLLGCGASLIGLGTDVAGSLRLPAHCCGVFGHKPTPFVVSTVGHYPDCKNREEWGKIFTMGPMARYAGDLKLLLEVIAEPDKKNSLKLDQKVDVKKLKVYYIDDPKAIITTRFNSNVVTAVETVVTHFDMFCETKCSKVNMPMMKYCPELSYLAMIMMIHPNDVDGVFEEKEVNLFLELLKSSTNLSVHSFNSVIFEILIRVVPRLFSRNSKEINASAQHLREHFLNILGDDGVFIFPASPMEATYHGDVFRRFMDPSYLSIFNLLGFPVTTCPVMFTPNGLPIGIQVVAAPNMDRLTLSVAEEIEKAFGGWSFNIDVRG